MDRTLRPSGIPFLGDIPWGSHICQFYRSREDLLDLLVPYFKAGLENNEFCMWVTSEPLSCADAETALRAAVRDFDTRLACGQILIVPGRDWYRTDGRLDTARALDRYVSKLQAALANGYAGLRVSASTYWLEPLEWNHFAEWEAKADALVNANNIIGLCTYSMDKCGAHEILDAAKNHAFALVRRDGAWEVVENEGRRRALQAATEFRKKYETLFGNMTGGFAYHQLISTECGEPVDYLFLEANEAFERLTGLKRDAILGRRASEVISAVRDGNGWIERYGRVALTGEPARFEEYSAHLGKSLSVAAYSPERGYFALIIEETGEPSGTRAVESDGPREQATAPRAN